jgi:putative endonuclease
MQKEHHYWVYILASKRNGTLYIGVTNDLYRRMLEHRDGTADSFTKRYSVRRLVWWECHQYVNGAITREKQLKKWNRAWKLRIIEEMNPNWDDLFEQLVTDDVWSAQRLVPRLRGDDKVNGNALVLDARLRGHDKGKLA